MGAEQLKVAGVIVIVEEGLRPAVTTLGDVVRITRKDSAGEAGYESQPATRLATRQISALSP